MNQEPGKSLWLFHGNLKKKKYFLLLFGEMFCKCQLGSLGYGGVHSFISLLTFCLEVPSIAKKSPNIIVVFSRSPFSTIKFCFMYLETMMIDPFITHYLNHFNIVSHIILPCIYFIFIKFIYLFPTER